MQLVGKIENIVIPNGANVSNVISAKAGRNSNLMLYGIDTTDGALTYTIEISADNTNWVTLIDSAGANVTPPLTGKGKDIPTQPAFLRIKSSGNVTAPRTWHATAEI